MIRTKIATALTTVGLAALTVAALPGAAQASAPDREAVSLLGTEDCPAEYFCFWRNADFKEEMGKVKGDNTSWTAFSQSKCQTGTWNDCASEVTRILTRSESSAPAEHHLEAVG